MRDLGDGLGLKLKSEILVDSITLESEDITDLKRFLTKYLIMLLELESLSSFKLDNRN